MTFHLDATYLAIAVAFVLGWILRGAKRGRR